MKILIFSNAPSRLTEVLRVSQLVAGLSEIGAEVVVSERGRDWTPNSQEETLQAVSPDIILFAAGWSHYFLSSKPDVPLVIDLCSPQILVGGSSGESVSVERKLTALSHADCLITESPRMKQYYYGWLVQAGRVPERDDFLRVVPPAIAGPLPHRIYPSIEDASSPSLVAFDKTVAGDAVIAAAREVKVRSRGTLSAYVGCAGSDVEKSLQEMFQFPDEDLGKAWDVTNRVQIAHMPAWEELLESVRRASVAIISPPTHSASEFGYSWEALVSMALGVPVVYVNFGELAGLIKRYGAGWLFDPQDGTSLATVLSNVFDDQVDNMRRGESARDLVRCEFPIGLSVEPLVDFVNSPQISTPVTPAYGSVVGRPSFLRPEGQKVSLPFGRESVEITQPFILPAENIASVSIPIALCDAPGDCSIQATITRKQGGSVCRDIAAEAGIVTNGRLLLKLPVLRGPAGGEELLLKLKFLTRGSTAGNSYMLDCLSKAVYPLFPAGGLPDGHALAISFVPGETSAVYRAKVLTKRAVWMAKQGEWKRLGKAIGRRFSVSSGRV